MTKQTEFNTHLSANPALLRQLGWNEHFERQLATLGDAQGRIARVVNVQRNLFLVTDGQGEWFCSPAGRLIHSQDHDYPITGDWVLADDAVVWSVIPRMNILSRGQAGSRNTRAGTATQSQAIAANLDSVFIVCGLDRDFNLRRLERYLALVYNCGLSPVVVLTKADLHDQPESFQLDVESIAFGVPVVLTSMLDNRGISELESHLGPGQTIAMLGSSGAGKSTLANLLHGSDIQATATVSASLGKGRHTTTTRELLRMPQGGMLIDNPGIREIAFFEDGSGMDHAFADIHDLAEKCRFADCTHTQEPGCAVLRAVEDGDLPSERLESYHKLEREMRYAAERRDKSANRVEKERWKGIAMEVKRLKKRGKR